MLLHEPLGDRAGAMKEDKCNLQMWLQMGARKGKQVAPAAFTRRLNDVHEQWRYPPITPCTFFLPYDFEERRKMTIVKGKRNRAVGTDGVHVEMLQAEPYVCASILSTWRGTVGRLVVFPDT